MTFHRAVELAALLMEGAGIGSMLVGVVLSAAIGVRALLRAGQSAAFRTLRESLGRAILLGLEFLVAADIIRTVSEAPTLESVTVLAVIVAIRTFLSFTLEVELDGRWPWQRSVTEPRKAAEMPGSTVPDRG